MICAGVKKSFARKRLTAGQDDTQSAGAVIASQHARHEKNFLASATS